MYDLKALEGELVKGIFFPIDPRVIHEVRLHKVDIHGIWIESQYVIEKILAEANQTSAGRSPVIFLPWTSIACVFDFVQTPALSDSSLL
jgi:hypothetical protein